MLESLFSNDKRIVCCLSLFVCLVWIVGCGKESAAPQRKPPTVVVAKPEKRDVQIYFETNGYTDANEYTTIPARVSGQLKEIRYTPGEIVFEGAPLFLIEQERYLANVDAAKASQESARAQSELAEADLRRSRILRESNTNTQEELDQDIAKSKVAKAKIHEADAELKNRELDLSYTDIRAPISGKTDKNLIDRGNIVGSTPENTNLTSIANMDPIFVYFSVSGVQVNKLQEIQSGSDEKTKAILERLKKNNGHNNEKETEPAPAPSKLETETKTEATPTTAEPAPDAAAVAKLQEQAKSFDDTKHLFKVALHQKAGGKFDYVYEGVVDFSSNRVDTKTGTLQFRGRVPNENYVILPGQAVQVQVPIYVEKDAIVIRDEAVCSDLNTKYVYVVDEKNIVSRKDVELGPLQPDGTRVVFNPKDGDPGKQLTFEDRYIVQGVQKVGVNKPVTIQENPPAPK